MIGIEIFDGYSNSSYVHYSNIVKLDMETKTIILTDKKIKLGPLDKAIITETGLM